MTDLEKKIKAKIPGEDTGIEVRRTMCDICAPWSHCGIDAYVKDGKVIKVEGIDGYPGNNGTLCLRGAASREYIYRKNRILYPMKRVGERGDGKYERISWDQALTEIAAKMNKIKAEYGPESVAFYCGYAKWYRPWLSRLANSFGSPNFGTESSSCAKATMMAWTFSVGAQTSTDFKNAGVFLGFGSNALINKFGMARNVRGLKERGGKVIIIDTRYTPTAASLADLFLQVHPGTDGALALCFGNLLIQKNAIDKEFIEKSVHGFEEYKAMVAEYTLEKASKITGVPEEKIVEAVDLMIANMPMIAYTPAATIPHHINGYNAIRSIIALCAITGSIDCEGGIKLLDCYGEMSEALGMPVDEEFADGFWREDMPERIGEKKFPVWAKYCHEMQSNDLQRAILEEDPYPVKGLIGLGFNQRMLLETNKFKEAYNKMDLIVAMDLVHTDVCEYADYILPAASSFERVMVQAYPFVAPKVLTATKPVIEPVGEAISDAEFCCRLSQYLGIDDPVMAQGYEGTLRHIMRDLPVTLEQLQEAPAPIKVDGLYKPHKLGHYRENGFNTISGKVELYSEVIASCNREDLNPLPVYYDGFDDTDKAAYPLTLIAGARIHMGLHSRMHEVPWVRNMRKFPTVDMHPEDAKARGIKEGDDIEIFSPYGKICVKAHLTPTGLPGDIYMYHGYKEANVNSLIGKHHTDPYSGFPGYRQGRVEIRKAEK